MNNSAEAKKNPSPKNDWSETVSEILKQGNVAEVKREKDNIVVVEIKRQVRIKKSIE